MTHATYTPCPDNSEPAEKTLTITREDLDELDLKETAFERPAEASMGAGSSPRVC